VSRKNLSHCRAPQGRLRHPAHQPGPKPRHFLRSALQNPRKYCVKLTPPQGCSRPRRHTSQSVPLTPAISICCLLPASTKSQLRAERISRFSRARTSVRFAVDPPMWKRNKFRAPISQQRSPSEKSEMHPKAPSPNDQADRQSPSGERRQPIRRSTTRTHWLAPRLAAVRWSVLLYHIPAARLARLRRDPLSASSALSAAKEFNHRERTDRRENSDAVR
jgi:hypothetical protein